LRANGFPDARRQPLYGAKDQGDIIVCEQPRILIECKAGAAASNASMGQIRAWLEQTETEAVNAAADLGVLVQYRRGRSVGDWPVWMAACDWIALLTGDELTPVDAPWPMATSLADWAVMARGWAER
jgi:hypothetical protein